MGQGEAYVLALPNNQSHVVSRRGRQPKTYLKRDFGCLGLDGLPIPINNKLIVLALNARNAKPLIVNDNASSFNNVVHSTPAANLLHSSDVHNFVHLNNGGSLVHSCDVNNLVHSIDGGSLVHSDNVENVVHSGDGDNLMVHLGNDKKLVHTGELGHWGDGDNLVHSGEITSETSGNSWAVATSSTTFEDAQRRGSSSGVSTSQVTVEIPKHDTSTMGIRKITFKFSKTKEDEHVSRYSVIDSNNDEIGLDDSSDRNSFDDNKELKMSKKVFPDGYPTTVKKLLATGILEGAIVKYVTSFREKELPGKISGCGYLCGCSLCNYTNVLSACEFEQHAGGAKTRHPNSHIFLENGRSIYSIIEKLKITPLGLLEDLVKDMAGSSFNPGSFHAGRDSLQQHDEPVQYYKKHRKTHHSVSKESHRLSSSTSLYAGFCKRSSDGGMRKRDNDLHRLLFLPNGIPDGAELAYYAKGQKILGGYKYGNGIVCSHCNCEISPSLFEAHAGWAARRQPYRHIYTTNGYSLHDLAISMADGQNVVTGNNDDMCTICGDRGELIPCGCCPRAYHQACLGLQNVPLRDWCCPNCNDRRTDLSDSSNTSKPIAGRLTRVVKNSEPEYGGCVLCRANDFSVDIFDDRTVIICDQCEKEYHVGCLREAGCSDLKELPHDKWFCSHDCDSIHVALRDLVARGPNIIPGSEAIKITRKLMLNGISALNDNDVEWRILSGKSRQHEHLPLLSRAVSIFRECFSPITAKIGRDLIPVMVHGRNISGQEFGGMYCVLLTVKSVVVSAALLRIFGREVAELPLVATSKEYQGKGFFLALFSRIENFLTSLKVENLVLPAAEKAKSMWVHRFGFRDMSDERLCFYARDYQLTEFNGTVMLEKRVEQMTD